MLYSSPPTYRMRAKRGFSVELVTPSTVDDFLWVYRSSFPLNHQDPVANIRDYAEYCGQWVQGTRRRSKDFLFLAREIVTRRPAGIATLSVYEGCRWGFVSWLAIAESYRSRGPLRLLWRSILETFQSFDWVVGILFELEEADPLRRDIAHHRMRLFQRAGARRLDLAYQQPSLDVSDDSRTAEPMHLMLLPLPGRMLTKGLSLPYAEALGLVDFVYMEFYRDTYIGQAIFPAYEQHVTALRERVLASLRPGRPVSLSTVRLPQPEMPEIFISQRTVELAYRIHDRLFAEGLVARFWEQHARAGTRAWRRIFEMMREAQCVLVVLTAREVTAQGLRPGILREVQWARRHRKPLIPLVSKGAEERLRLIHHTKNPRSRAWRMMREACGFLSHLTWVRLNPRDVDRTLISVTPRLWKIVGDQLP